MSGPSPCPGCDVEQHGERVKLFRRKEVLSGVGRKA